MSTVLGGKAEIAINNITIPASLLSEISVELTEGVRERTTLGGKFSRPSGALESAMAKFTMFLPNMDYLKNIFPERFNAPTGLQTEGNIILNADTCVNTEAGAVNIHFSCDENDNNDVYFYAALAQLNFAATYNASDDIAIEITLFAQPDADGNIARLGTGDLTQDSIYDATSEATVPTIS
jgi:hypothetical protein